MYLDFLFICFLNKFSGITCSSSQVCAETATSFENNVLFAFKLCLNERSCEAEKFAAGIRFLTHDIERSFHRIC